jgi:hypothetical protein
VSTSPRLPNLSDPCSTERTHTSQPVPTKSALRISGRNVHQSVIRTPFHAAATGVGARTARRHITPQAGFALQGLGHAIEYLADQYVHEAGSIPSIHGTDPRIEAIQILMAANREVYFGCAVVPSLWHGLRRRFFGSN